VFRRTWSIINF